MITGRNGRQWLQMLVMIVLLISLGTLCEMLHPPKASALLREILEPFVTAASESSDKPTNDDPLPDQGSKAEISKDSRDSHQPPAADSGANNDSDNLADSAKGLSVIPDVQLKLPSVQVDTPIVDIETPEVQVNTGSGKLAPDVEAKLPSVQADTPIVDIETPEIRTGTDMPILGADTPSNEDAPIVDVDTPVGDVAIPAEASDPPASAVVTPDGGELSTPSPSPTAISNPAIDRPEPTASPESGTDLPEPTANRKPDHRVITNGGRQDFSLPVPTTVPASERNSEKPSQNVQSGQLQSTPSPEAVRSITPPPSDSGLSMRKKAAAADKPVNRRQRIPFDSSNAIMPGSVIMPSVSSGGSGGTTGSSGGNGISQWQGPYSVLEQGVNSNPALPGTFITSVYLLGCDQWCQPPPVKPPIKPSSQPI